jgi:hypothetical protein
MSDGISNAQLFDVLLEMKSDIGKLVQGQETQTAWMTRHVAEDALMAEDIKKLQIGASRIRGIVSALSVVGTVVGAAVGYAVDLLAIRGHH